MYTKEELIEATQTLTIEEQIDWMIALGAELTVVARGGYPFNDEPGDLKHLITCNELQHRVYGRIRDLRRGHEWTLESFVALIVDHMEATSIPGDIAWAVKRSMPKPPGKPNGR